MNLRMLSSRFTVIYRASAIAALLALVGCAQAHIATSPKSITVSWAGECGAGSPLPYYQLVLFPSGAVNYTGIRGVKARGARVSILRMSPEEVRAVAVQLRALIEEPANDRMGISNTERDCLLLQSHDKRREVSVKNEGLHQLHGLMRESNEMRHLLCPAQRSVPMRDEYCSQPVISFLYRERASCRLAHATEIYSNGVAHYYILGSGADYRDRYAEVDMAVMGSLTKEFDGKPGEISGVPFRSLRLYGSDAMLLRDRLQKAVVIGEYESLPDDSSCGGDLDALQFPLADVVLPK